MNLQARDGSDEAEMGILRSYGIPGFAASGLGLRPILRSRDPDSAKPMHTAPYMSRRRCRKTRCALVRLRPFCSLPTRHIICSRLGRERGGKCAKGDVVVG